MKFLARAVFAALSLDHEAAPIRMQPVKAPAEIDLRASLLRLRGEPLNQRAAFDDEIGMIQRDGGGAAVGEKLEAADFIEDAALGGFSQKGTHAMRHDQGARFGFERFDPLKDAH